MATSAKRTSVFWTTASSGKHRASDRRSAVEGEVAIRERLVERA
jgi:hypothetical protein